MAQETTQYAVTLSTHDIKWQGLVSMETIAYIKFRSVEGNSEGFCVSGAFVLSRFHTQI